MSRSALLLVCGLLAASLVTVTTTHNHPPSAKPVPPTGSVSSLAVAVDNELLNEVRHLEMQLAATDVELSSTQQRLNDTEATLEWVALLAEPEDPPGGCHDLSLVGGYVIGVDEIDGHVTTRLAAEVACTWFADEDQRWAMSVMGCESGYDPEVVRVGGSDTGFFQVIRSTLDWVVKTSPINHSHSEMKDPFKNGEVAAWLYYEAGGRSHWTQSKSCWGSLV